MTILEVVALYGTSKNKKPKTRQGECSCSRQAADLNDVSSGANGRCV